MKYEYEGEFLKQWPPARRSLITNQFCSAVRDGLGKVDAVLEWVERDAERRISETLNYARKAPQELLLSVIDTDEARSFAQHIIDRESLSYEERQRLKRESGIDFQRAYMATQPPTLKQLAYLKSLGCSTNPKTKLEASALIERYKNGNVSRSEHTASSPTP